MLVRVFAGSRYTAAFAQSILRDVGINFVVRNDEVQYLVGLGQIGSGYNLAAGPVEILVNSMEAAPACEILQSVGREKVVLPFKIRVLLLAFLVGSELAFYAMQLLIR